MNVKEIKADPNSQPKLPDKIARTNWGALLLQVDPIVGPLQTIYPGGVPGFRK